MDSVCFDSERGFKVFFAVSLLLLFRCLCSELTNWLGEMFYAGRISHHNKISSDSWCRVK